MPRATSSGLLPGLADLARTILHTHKLPLYATNPCVVDATANANLYLIRLTPLTIGCSALPVATVLSASYALNSWSLLARLSNNNSWTILARVQNSQDARGWLDHHHHHHNESNSTASLWVLHNTIPNGAVATTSGESPPSRMELLRYSCSDYLCRDNKVKLRQRTLLRYDATSPTAAEKNWVPITFTRKRQGGTRHLLVSHTLLPHRVLRCGSISGVCTLAHESDSTSVWSAALNSLGGLVGRQCVTSTSSSSASSSSACNASRGLPYSFPPPRGGTPCVSLFGLHVCLGHLKARMRGQYKSTYYHFFYALSKQPPYRVLNVSYPFRFATLGKQALEYTRAALGPSGFTRKLTSFIQEKIQFASGLVRRGDKQLMVSWGVADCAGAVRAVNVSLVGEMLAGRRVMQL